MIELKQHYKSPLAHSFALIPNISFDKNFLLTIHVKSVKIMMTGGIENSSKNKEATLNVWPLCRQNITSGRVVFDQQ